jgi:hypothetical protein
LTNSALKTMCPGEACMVGVFENFPYKLKNCMVIYKIATTKIHIELPICVQI